MVAIATTNAADQILAFARAQIGKPYKWAAKGPDAYDCSGLVVASFASVGISLPHYTGLLILRGQKITRSELIAGDLVFPDSGHVQIYSGGGNVIEAPTAGLNVREVPMWGFWQARRILPNTGSAVMPITATQGISNPLNPLSPVTSYIDTQLGKFMSSARHWVWRVAEVLIGISLVSIGVAKLTDVVPIATKIAGALK